METSACASNDITQHPHDHKETIGILDCYDISDTVPHLTVCDVLQFTTSAILVATTTTVRAKWTKIS